jgi:hypothetical protein
MVNKKLIQDIRPPRCQKRQRVRAVKSGRRAFSVTTKLLFVSFIILVVLAGVLLISPTGRMYVRAFAALTQGNYQLKIFIQNSEVIEQTVNDWLASQENIVVDQIKANSYGGDYAVIVKYHRGGSGGVSTRIKIFNANTLTETVGDSQETTEMRAQEFISSLSSEHNIRSADMLAGSGPWDIFIVYDDKQGSTQDEISAPVNLNISLDKPIEQDTANISPDSTTPPESTISPEPAASPEPESVTDTNIIDNGATKVTPDDASTSDETSNAATTPTTDIQGN